MKPLKQPSLIPTGKNRLNIKSPVFTPRPGWGGQLSAWWSRTSESRLPTVFALTLIAFIGTYWMISDNSSGGKVKIPDIGDGQAASTDSLQATIFSGQGLTHAARTVLREYMQVNDISLTPEQFIYAENNLRLTVPSRPVEPGQVISFPLDSIKKTILDAKAAPASALQKLTPYTK